MQSCCSNIIPAPARELERLSLTHDYFYKIVQHFQSSCLSRKLGSDRIRPSNLRHHSSNALRGTTST